MIFFTNFLKNKQKAQISIEVIFSIILLLVFINLFNVYSKNIVETIEISKLKKQQTEINYNIYDFLKAQEYVISDENITVFNATLPIPTPLLVSTKGNCDVNFSDNFLIISTNYNDKIISSAINVYLEDTIIRPENDVLIKCGEQLFCELKISDDNRTIVCESS